MHHTADPKTKDQTEATLLPYWVKGCLYRAHETVYWPSTNAEITDYTSRNATSECHFRVTRLKDHLSVMSPHQGHGRKLPLTSSHLMTRIISAQ